MTETYSDGARSLCSACGEIHSPYVVCTQMPSAPSPGIKSDAGKLRWSLVPWRAMEPVVRVLMAGSRKYSDDNWLRVPDAPRRYRDAALRHLLSYAGGESRDPETGESHLAHCACCLLFLLHFESNPQSKETP